jgi:hypothetical protein
MDDFSRRAEEISRKATRDFRAALEASTDARAQAVAALLHHSDTLDATLPESDDKATEWYASAARQTAGQLAQIAGNSADPLVAAANWSLCNAGNKDSKDCDMALDHWISVDSGNGWPRIMKALQSQQRGDEAGVASALQEAANSKTITIGYAEPLAQYARAFMPESLSPLARLAVENELMSLYASQTFPNIRPLQDMCSDVGAPERTTQCSDVGHLMTDNATNVIGLAFGLRLKEQADGLSEELRAERDEFERIKERAADFTSQREVQSNPCEYMRYLSRRVEARLSVGELAALRAMPDP